LMTGVVEFVVRDIDVEVLDETTASRT
jgi:hypothetical protein